MAETNRWMCDKCGQWIESIDDGYVQWITFSDDKVGRDLQLVHHLKEPDCKFDYTKEDNKDGGRIGDEHFEFYHSPNGLMTMLSWIADEKLPLAEIVEMIKRIHIPGYEEARLYIDEALSQGIIEQTSAKNFPSVNEIDYILDWKNGNTD